MDAFDLERFVDAQAEDMDDVIDELRRGRKETHWMWYIFPQIRGLGHSPMAQRYGIVSRDEAKAYLDHPVLGPRLRECTRLVNAVEGRTAEQIFGGIDAMKFRSSMTLFAAVDEADGIFAQALAKYFNSQPDRLTLERLH